MAAEYRVGVSVSESAELDRLGLVESHLRLALGEVARVIIRAGASLVYGGHLRPDGYTAFLESELERYSSADWPLHLVVGWSEHRRMSLQELEDHKNNLGLKARVTYLDPVGQKVPPDAGRGNDPESVADVSAALSALRRYLIGVTDARVLIGGKEDGFQGAMPGIVEEALLSIEAGQPLFLAGGFGGATATVASVVAGIEERWPPGERDTDLLRETIANADWELQWNGLDAAQNQRLATTHRPSEVASLVALGLRRIRGCQSH